jgi:hypothetical protein
MADMNKEDGKKGDKAKHGHRDGPSKSESAEAVQHHPTEHTADKTTNVTNANPATSSVSAGAPASAGGSRPVSGPAGAIADHARTNADAAQPVESPASDEEAEE